MLAGMRKSRRYNVMYVNFEHEREFLYLGPDGAFIMKHSLSFLCLKKYCIILLFPSHAFWWMEDIQFCIGNLKYENVVFTKC